MLIQECAVGMYVVINNPNEGYLSHEYDGCIAEITKRRMASVDLLVGDTERPRNTEVIYVVDPKFINQLIQGDPFDDFEVEVIT